MFSAKRPKSAERVVHVHAYARLRFGKMEWVTSHLRSLPRF